MCIYIYARFVAVGEKYYLYFTVVELKRYTVTLRVYKAD